MVAATELTLEQAVGQKLMIAFTGYDLPAHVYDLLHRRHVGGVTLFRSLNVAYPEQVRRLSAALQDAAAASGQPPLLIATDQEGGTLTALAGTTPFPGNMALGATGDPALARAVGYALGQELAAQGVNVNYAPVCDVNSNPRNPGVGPRSFGEDPAAVAALAAALVMGLQDAGVAATLKHFPGHGDTSTDSHHAMPVLRHDAARVRTVELPPFKAGIAAGARLVMTAHIALPALTGDESLPATLSPAILRGLLREELGFDGVIISDAMDMSAIEQGMGLAIEAIAAAHAGVDLLILGETLDQEMIHAGLLQAARRGLLPAEETRASARRVLALKEWLRNRPQPPLSVVNSSEHQTLACQVAARALTLVRDSAGRLPLRLPATARIAAVVPRPADLTPADTSSYEQPALAAALRRYHPQVDEFSIPLAPTAADVAALGEHLAGYDLVVAGTINATDHVGQAALVNLLLDRAVPVIAVALRLPYDLEAYPAAPTYLCTYSLLAPSLETLADALWGQAPFAGRLPVTIPGFYARGHGG